MLVSTSLIMQIHRFSLLHIAVYQIPLDFYLLVKAHKQLEVVTLGTWKMK